MVFTEAECKIQDYAVRGEKEGKRDSKERRPHLIRAQSRNTVTQRWFAIMEGTQTSLSNFPGSIPPPQRNWWTIGKINIEKINYTNMMADKSGGVILQYYYIIPTLTCSRFHSNYYSMYVLSHNLSWMDYQETIFHAACELQLYLLCANLLLILFVSWKDQTPPDCMHMNDKLLITLFFCPVQIGRSTSSDAMRA